MTFEEDPATITDSGEAPLDAGRLIPKDGPLWPSGSMNGYSIEMSMQRYPVQVSMDGAARESVKR